MTTNVRPGDILAGKFSVERVLGEGGMGYVVAARHLELDKLVALKFMLPEFLRNYQAVERFLREARAAARLESPHVGRVLDVGKLDNGAPYIVMEYLEGNDLGALLKERGALPVAEAVGYVLQACEAMAEAHAAGIVHRDLKPQNLFLTKYKERPTIKVLDFGISKAALSPIELTSTSSVMGSPAWMSPEQFRSAKNVDARTDIWALGVILYQLISGQLPFDADSAVAVGMKVVTETPTPITQLRPGTPQGLERVIDRCLEKDRDARYANIAELAAALEVFAPTHSPRSDTPFAPPLATFTPAIASAVASTTLGSSAAEITARGPSRRWPWMLGGGCVIALVGVLVVAANGGKPNGGDPSPAVGPAAPATLPALSVPPAPAVSVSPAQVDAGVASDLPVADQLPARTVPAETTARAVEATPRPTPKATARKRSTNVAKPPATTTPADTPSDDDGLFDHRVKPVDPVQERVKPVK